MTECERFFNLRICTRLVLNPQTIYIVQRQLELFPVPVRYFPQTFFGDVNADNLTDQPGEYETILIYLGQVLPCTVSHDVRRQSIRDVESIVSESDT